MQIAAEADLPGTIGPTTSQVGEQAIGLDVQHGVIQTAGTMADGLGHVLLAQVEGTPVAGLFLFRYGPAAI